MTDAPHPRPPDLLPLADLPAEDRARLLALNNAHAEMTSYLEPADWERMQAQATLALGLPGAGGFVLAFAPPNPYPGLHFAWFRNRFERFLYVDRIVVDPHLRGRGIARALYGAVFGHAAAAGLGRVTCEIYRVPPNPVSDAFHEALGFRELGLVPIPGTGKTVRYMERPVGA